jgi:hypothetical protein
MQQQSLQMLSVGPGHGTGRSESEPTSSDLSLGEILLSVKDVMSCKGNHQGEGMQLENLCMLRIYGPIWTSGRVQRENNRNSTDNAYHVKSRI